MCSSLILCCTVFGKSRKHIKKKTFLHNQCEPEFTDKNPTLPIWNWWKNFRGMLLGWPLPWVPTSVLAWKQENCGMKKHATKQPVATQNVCEPTADPILTRNAIWYGLVPAVPEQLHSFKPGSQVKLKSVIGNTLKLCPNSTLSKFNHYLFVFMDHLDAMWDILMCFLFQYMQAQKHTRPFLSELN